MTIFYFTSTGNSLAVAKAIGGKTVSIPPVIDEPELRFEDDAIGLVFPIYGFSTPKMVRRFVEKADWKADYTFAIGTYGNMPGACMYSVQHLAEKHGKRFDYAESLLTVDNFLPMFEMADQEAKLPQKKTAENLARIVAEVSARTRRQAPASLPLRAFSKVISSMQKSAMDGSFGKHFTVNDSCTKCGVCAKVCPCGNISVKGAVSFGGNCEFCLGCAHLCPQNAIHVKGERSAKRWRHPDVTLNEIISANNRTL